MNVDNDILFLLLPGLYEKPKNNLYEMYLKTKGNDNIYILLKLDKSEHWRDTDQNMLYYLQIFSISSIETKESGGYLEGRIICSLP